MYFHYVYKLYMKQLQLAGKNIYQEARIFYGRTYYY